MGGEPVSALQLVCWPRDEISFDVLAEVINGGLDIMAEAGCTVIGGHSIDDKEPKYGFSVTGVIKDNPILNNNILDKDDFKLLVENLKEEYDVIALAHSEYGPTLEWVDENLEGKLKIGFSTPQLRDYFKVVGQPITLILDTNGEVIFRDFGEIKFTNF